MVAHGLDRGGFFVGVMPWLMVMTSPRAHVPNKEGMEHAIIFYEVTRT